MTKNEGWNDGQLPANIFKPWRRALILNHRSHPRGQIGQHCFEAGRVAAFN
ncbi:hypothetical protein [Nitrosospira sp. NpAV]|uniref:hypothetical protein n=1 Tax=Nitrosospira sp. NpAV TaxID=58133 RepID=UPI0012EC40E2|nr:hypothetical protein [Nitrosospira sp. NpAV]